MIKITARTTEEAEKFFRDNITKIGRVISVEHTRNSKKIEYETIFVGESGKLVIDGGLSSGYTGTGPNGFIRVLKQLGMDEDTAVNLVQENTDNIHKIKHVF